MDNQEAETKAAEGNPDIKETVQKQPAKSHGHDAKPTVIIIKRVKKHIHKHHGGAWKIAYADFVTAMMTFFLLLWLLAMLNKYQLQGISEYFKNPTKSVIPKQPDDIKKDKVESTETKKTDVLAAPPKTQSNPSETKEELEKRGRAESEKIKKDLEQQIKSNPKISEFANSLNFVVQANGLKIELRDLENKTMFSSGKTDFGSYAKVILDWLGLAVNKYPNRIMIVGHTDNKPFGTDENYTNWELSADRANATRRELIKHGMVPEKIVRIVGTAAVDKLATAVDDSDPSNRRISIIILTEDAYQKELGE